MIVITLRDILMILALIIGTLLFLITGAARKFCNIFLRFGDWILRRGLTEEEDDDDEGRDCGVKADH